jgi:hypothetical protein
MINRRKGSPVWFCHQHMMLGSGEKYDLLKKKYGSQQS